MPRGAAFRAVVCVAALAAGMMGWAGSLPAPLAARQESTPAVEVGAGPIGEPALRFVGRSDYRPDLALVYGYLTDAIGLDPTLLFTDPAARAPATARFTYAGEVALSERSVRGDVTTLRGSGTVTIYLDEAGGATWDAPETFADGLAIAAFEIELRDTLQRQSPESGVVVGDERLRQVAAPPFRLGGERYRFGHVGAEQRLRFVGAPIAAAKGTAGLVASLAGSAIVTARNPSPPPDEPEPIAATPTIVAACPALEPWLGEALARLERARSLGLEGSGEAADEVAALAAAQREAVVPEAGAEANRLAVTALSTLARGLRLAAAAAGNGDEAAVAQARAVLADGDSLAERALAALSQLAAACDGAEP